ncbi:DsbA family protein [Bartonella sp. AR 15-3]|uniref:DsbA family protein n=1 Tax=Bartonella sp. AR 15-3 TaxID=545617 RepID=UPI0001F4BFA5|nr:DsbA family protein [Bartonella sp. AR 15-3]OPB31613.1 Protein-disulfide isomerase [Bartonella sp. AR 15-3]CBI79364.1 Outer membrane protein [Bartonella sp. AR 15-3]
MIDRAQYFELPFMKFFLIAIVLSVFTYSFLSYAQTNEQISNNLTIENLKIQLLEDSAFLSKLREKSTKNINDDHIREIIRGYLLNNPEIMIEMQLILQEKFEQRRQQEAQKQAEIIKLLEKEIFQSPYDAVLGNPNGKIVLVEFFDYNCGHCKRSYSDLISLTREYSDLRIVIKDLPILGSDSIETHIIAYVFRKLFPEKYLQFHKKLLMSQGRTNEAKAIKIAVSLGANEKELRNAMQNSNLQKFFQENIQIASALNINGAPAYIIGDKIFIGAVEKNILQAAIENAQ